MAIPTPVSSNLSARLSLRWRNLRCLLSCWIKDVVCVFSYSALGLRRANIAARSLTRSFVLVLAMC